MSPSYCLKLSPFPLRASPPPSSESVYRPVFLPRILIDTWSPSKVLSLLWLCSAQVHVDYTTRLVCLGATQTQTQITRSRLSLFRKNRNARSLVWGARVNVLVSGVHPSPTFAAVGDVKLWCTAPETAKRTTGLNTRPIVGVASYHQFLISFLIKYLFWLNIFTFSLIFLCVRCVCEDFKT